MKSVEQQNIKKYCNFYVSNLHLSIMLLPYINKEINEDVEVTTIFEQIEKSEFKKVVDKLNIIDKEKIMNIKWINPNETDEKIEKEIQKNILEKNNITFIIGGSKKYIKDKNNTINKYINNTQNKSIKIINCFNVEEISKEMNSIAKEYDAVLNTITLKK